MGKQIKLTVSILGCGWLGLPLAEELLQQGYAVNGSTTTSNKLEHLAKKGIDPFFVELTEESVKGEVFSFLDGAEVLVVDIPPGLRKKPDANFVKKIEHFIPKLELSAVEKVILVSSTSVFQDEENFPEYSEKSTPNGKNDAARQLQEVEKLFQENKHFKTTVIRMGGLLGEDRHPVKFLSGRKGISNPLAPVNLIQQQDAVQLIVKALQQENFGSVFHGVYPLHPNKEEYYTQKAKLFNLALPEFTSDKTSEGKKISSAATQKALQFAFQHSM